MNIAVNLGSYFQGKIGGLENYVRHVVGGVAAEQENKKASLTIFAQDSEVDNVRQFASQAKVVSVTHQTATQVVEAELKRADFDLLFCPLLVLDPLRPPIPSCVMMPDVQHEFLPELFDADVLRWRRHNYRPSAVRADVVYTLSENAKSTIVEKFQINPEKIEVVYLDVDKEFHEPATPEVVRAVDSLRLPENYLLFPANFWPHKNHSALLRAMQILVRGKYPKLGLVLTGAPSTGAERIEKEITKLGLNRNVWLLGYQERQVVVELYRRARVLAFVSRFEGFGIPILEAFSTGTPVITSGSTSCPEIAGDAALIVDETNPATIAKSSELALEDSDLCRSLVEKGRVRAKQFSWKRAIDLTLASFERIVSTRKQAETITIQEYPVVSIVTPALNMARFLEETIRSVLSQNYPHIDYIVMDGGSTDGSVEILKKYCQQLRYVSQPDEGPADAINRGLKSSRGSIFAYLNADDTYLPGAIETAVRHMLADPYMAVTYGEGYHVRENGEVIDRYPTLPFDFQLLNKTCYICQPAAFIWRHALDSVGGMDTGLRVAFDYDLWIRIAKLYPMQKIDDYLATSRMYSGNITLGRRAEVYREIMQIVKTHYGYVPCDWVYGYACYLIDRKDQFFEPSRPSLAKLGLSLALGSYYNSTKLLLYWKAWFSFTNPSKRFRFKAFRDRWADGWISKHFAANYRVGDRCEVLRILGRHFGPFRRALKLRIRINGTTLRVARLVGHGPFVIEIDCPPEVRGKDCLLEIQASSTFVPARSGDYRRLSCIIDSISFDEPA